MMTRPFQSAIRRFSRLVGICGFVLAAVGGTLEAQQAAVPAYRRALATRADLEATAADLERRGDADSRWAAGEVRKRLTDGDFRQGDRIILRVDVDTALSDTFTVRAGAQLELPQVAPLPLRGVLRSELEQVVRQHLMQYFRSATITATPLIRFGVLGAVGRPGYYYMPADIVVNDAFMIAGGLVADARIDKSTFRRGTEEFKNKEAARKALASGKSLDELNIQSGDEIRVATGGANQTFTYVAIITGVVTSIAVLATTVF